MKGRKIKHYYSYRFCIGEGTVDLLQQWKLQFIINVARPVKTNHSLKHEIPALFTAKQ